MALAAAPVREHHPDATEIALGLDYDPDGQTFIGSASLRRGDGTVIDADEDDLDELRYDIGTAIASTSWRACRRTALTRWCPTAARRPPPQAAQSPE